MKELHALISELITYGKTKKLIDPADETYTINRLLELFGADDYEATACDHLFRPLHEILEDMTQWAVDKGLLEDSSEQRDLFDTKICGLITPPPSVVRRIFAESYNRSPEAATDEYYTFSRDTNYIRTDRVAKDEKWVTETGYGPIEITINLSKPEKDPRDIAKAGQTKSSGYPKCLLCAENEGYAGHPGHPARQNHRIIPLRLRGEDYFLQYSPYVYYNEHCIIFNRKHIPMVINRSTFEKLIDFERQFPHYTIGSNADLPIVGGSILSHDHFQGGNYLFPMAKARIEEEIKLPGFPGIDAGIVNWPMSVIRLCSNAASAIVYASDHILNTWREYSDKDACIFAETNGTPHNTITPIARMRNGKYEMDLVLRNNITTEECPMGLYHPHNEYHHIKKENIGLIEVQGLAILPARLKKELALLKESILNGKDLRSVAECASHADWAENWLPRFRQESRDCSDKAAFLDHFVQDEVGHYFARILECSGVYKTTPEGREAFHRFLGAL